MISAISSSAMVVAIALTIARYYVNLHQTEPRLRASLAHFRWAPVSRVFRSRAVAAFLRGRRPSRLCIERCITKQTVEGS